MYSSLTNKKNQDLLYLLNAKLKYLGKNYSFYVNCKLINL